MVSRYLQEKSSRETWVKWSFGCQSLTRFIPTIRAYSYSNIRRTKLSAFFVLTPEANREFLLLLYSGNRLFAKCGQISEISMLKVAVTRYMPTNSTMYIHIRIKNMDIFS